MGLVINHHYVRVILFFFFAISNFVYRYLFILVYLVKLLHILYHLNIFYLRLFLYRLFVFLLRGCCILWIIYYFYYYCYCYYGYGCYFMFLQYSMFLLYSMNLVILDLILIILIFNRFYYTDCIEMAMQSMKFFFIFIYHYLDLKYLAKEVQSKYSDSSYITQVFINFAYHKTVIKIINLDLITINNQAP